MAYIEVDVHIDIDEHLHEVSTDVLQEELKGRGVQVEEKVIQLNLIDQIKFEEFMKVFKDVPQNEFDSFINKYKK